MINSNNSFIWDKEFEDCFKSNILTEALNRWLKEEECTHIIDEKIIQDNITPEKSIVHFIKKYLYNNSLPELDKPALAEHLANVFIGNMSEEEIMNTPVGKALSKIIEIIVYGKPFEIF